MPLLAESFESLARRAVAAKHWRWMPGMLTNVGERVRWETYCLLGTMPDLTDPATRGCLLALVREAWECPTAGRPEPGIPWLGVSRVGDVFEVAVGTVTLAVGRTEAAALVAALEAAP